MIRNFDIFFFIGTFFFVLFVGLYAGKDEKTKEDYFLGGRSLPWWGVCGSLFGTNISANHIVGMLGIGFSVGFAQSHYEFGSILAILLLAYVFLPILRRKKYFTLSQFLEQRYGQASSYLYSLISLILILIQLTGALYIGGRAFLPFAKQLSDSIQYEHLVILLALTATIYTWFGGLKSVVYTDVIQTVLILVSGIVLAYLALHRPEIGGLSGLWRLEQSTSQELSRMNIYLPSNHEVLPWTGVLSGMFILHIFYWNTNQYVVQRALGARSLKEARLGILASGFLKLTVPFFSILTGVAAFHIWKQSGFINQVDPDEAFSKLVLLIVPAGYGIIGLILAGLLGAIFSSVDSMLHSAATLFTIDIYLPLMKKIHFFEHIMTKETEDYISIQMGRWFIIFFSILTTILALIFFNPASKDNFFITLSSQSSNFTPGILVIFVIGVFWKNANQTSAWIIILLTPVISYLLPIVYESKYNFSNITLIFGQHLNFLHRVFLVTILTTTFHILLSLLFNKRYKLNALEKENLPKGKFIPSIEQILFGIYLLLLSFGIYLKLYFQIPKLLLFVVPFLITIISAYLIYRKKQTTPGAKNRIVRTDILLSGLLVGITVGFYFLF
ncbi:SLC5 family protein [Leptospira ognonensis]|nr:sodium/solute symporter [Leptospira ognonensis]